MDFTTREIIVGLLGSLGGIGGIVGLLVFITQRFDARRERLRKLTESQIENAVEQRRTDLEFQGKDEDRLVENLWKIVGEKDAEIAELKKDLEECQNQSVLSRPKVNMIYRNLREMRTQVESINVIMLDQDKTNIFFTRFNRIDALIKETEDSLP